MRTSTNEPTSEATPSCSYKRIRDTVMRNGADHKL